MDLSVLKNWWWLTVNGIAAISFGLVAILNPEKSLILLLGYFGVLAIALGALFMLGGFLNRKLTKLWDFWFMEGVLNATIGLILLYRNDITILIFQILLAIWAILMSAIQIITVIRMWEYIQNKWLYLTNGVFALAFGISIMTIPISEEGRLAFFVGAYAILLGIFSILISLNLKRIGGEDQESQTHIYKYHHQ